jgi:hypothetical protein
MEDAMKVYVVTYEVTEADEETVVLIEGVYADEDAAYEAASGLNAGDVREEEVR